MTDLAENRRRIAEYRRTRSVLALWPGITPERLRAAHARLRAVTEAVLRGSGEPSLVAVDSDEAHALGVAGFMGGMGALVGSWIASGRVRASRPAEDLFALHLDHGRRRVTGLHERLDEIVDAMRLENVEPIVLKGVHTGSVYFPEPGTRPAADIDLLVPPGDVERAERALRRAGLHERRRTVWAARSEWEPAGSSHDIRSLELEHADDPWSVDLHASLDRWYFRGVRRGLGPRAFERMTEAAIGGRTVRVVAQPQLTTFLALHASQEIVKVRMIRLVELALVIRPDLQASRLDWEELMELVRRTETERFVQPALALADSLLPGLVPPQILEPLDRAATPRTHRVLAAVRAADFAPLTHRSLDSKLMWASGPRELALNLSELMVPSDDGEVESLFALYRERVRGLLRGTVRWRARGAGS